MKSFKKIFMNTYVIAGIIIFLLLFGIGLYLEFSVGESLLASAALAAVGTISIWWQREWFACCIMVKSYFEGIVASRENVTEKFSKVWQFSGQSDGEVPPD